MKLSKRNASAFRHILLFGPPKSGKTELAGKISEIFNVLWIDLENGVDTLNKLPEEWKERVEVISIPDTQSNPVAITTLLKIVKGDAVEICEEHGVVSCFACKKAEAPVVRVCLKELDETWVIVIDSLTQATVSGINHITKAQPIDYKLTFDDYGNLGKLMDALLSHIQQAKNHFVCITHETEAELEDGKMKVVPTAGTRNFSRNSAKFFDEVAYLQVRNGRHMVGTGTTYANNILTGSRGGHMLEKEAEPSLIPILQGKVKTHNPVTAGSPGEKAAAALAAMKAKGTTK